MGASASVQPESNVILTEEQRRELIRRRAERLIRKEQHVIKLSSDPKCRAALKDSDLSNSTHRKLKAKALGRRADCKVLVSTDGFSLQRVKICEGQVIAFHWQNSYSLKNLSVKQVVDNGAGSMVDVVGGFVSQVPTGGGVDEQQFNEKGEYTFVIIGVKCEPLVVEVHPRADILVDISDESGFDKKIVRIDEGNTVVWNWQHCRDTHSVVEYKFDHSTGKLIPTESGTVTTSTTGSVKKHFSRPGLFYFKNKGTSKSDGRLCIVHVRERQREYKIRVSDNEFDPPLIVIQQGDRVWWEWNKNNCTHAHKIHSTSCRIANESAKSARPLPYSWSQSSNAGLMSQEFFIPGVYHYTDSGIVSSSDKSTRKIQGTIVVKPKAKEHFVEYSKNGFNPDVIRANAGDLIWWTWIKEEVDQQCLISEMERAILASPRNSGKIISGIDPGLAAQKINAGVELFHPKSAGVYHFQKVDGNGKPEMNTSACSVIVGPEQKNNTVHISEEGIEPQVTRIKPGDRIWWVWPQSSRPQNVVQVNSNGDRVVGGFQSDNTGFEPSAYTVLFTTPGVYHYKSDGGNGKVGTIVVEDAPKIHEVKVGTGSLADVPEAQVGDVVAWELPHPTKHDLMLVRSQSDIELAHNKNSNLIVPRRVISKVCDENGVFQYSGRSLLLDHSAPVNQSEGQGEALYPRISKVIVGGVNDEVDLGPQVESEQEQEQEQEEEEEVEEREEIIEIQRPKEVVPPPPIIKQIEVPRTRTPEVVKMVEEKHITIVEDKPPKKVRMPVIEDDPVIYKRIIITPNRERSITQEDLIIDTKSPRRRSSSRSISPRSGRACNYSEIIENLHSGRPSTGYSSARDDCHDRTTPHLCYKLHRTHIVTPVGEGWKDLESMDEYQDKLSARRNRKAGNDTVVTLYDTPQVRNNLIKPIGVISATPRSPKRSPRRRQKSAKIVNSVEGEDVYYDLGKAKSSDYERESTVTSSRSRSSARNQKIIEVIYPRELFNETRELKYFKNYNEDDLIIREPTLTYEVEADPKMEVQNNKEVKVITVSSKTEKV